MTDADILTARFAAAVEQARNDRETARIAVSTGANERTVRRTNRAFLKALGNVLQIYGDPRNWLAPPTILEPSDIYGGEPLLKLPGDLAWSAGGLLGGAGVGNIHGPIEAALGARGRAAAGPTEARDVRLAGIYVRLARLKRIADDTPVATVCEAFGGANVRTVQGWAASISKAELDILTEADLLNAPSAMRSAGNRMLSAGRTAGAILARAKSTKRE